MPRIAILVWCFAQMAALAALAQGQAQTVSKVAEDFSAGGWQPAQGSTAGGTVTTADDPGGGGARDLVMEPSFTGSFGGFNAEPLHPLVLPGRTKTVTVREKIDDDRFGLRVFFRDGWGRDSVNGTALVWELKTAPAGQWQEATFTVPDEWVQPISIIALGTHNWNAQSEKKKIAITVSPIHAVLELDGVDSDTGLTRDWMPNPSADAAHARPPLAKLTTLSLSTAEAGNVFTTPNAEASLRLQNWRAAPLKGTVKISVRSFDNFPLSEQSQEVSVDGITTIKIPLSPGKFGVYRVSAEFAGANAPPKDQIAFAMLPPPRELTEAQKDSSPYGINFHGAGRLLLSPFRRAGLVWSRDYAFNYEWFEQAKGTDGRYAGWPFFPKILEAYRDADMKLDAVLNGIRPPAMKDGRLAGAPGPNLQWTRDVADIILHFPQIRTWEMANEYDLPTEHAVPEQATGWLNYQEYHEKLAELVTLFGGGTMRTIENGRAGIWPDLERACVASGAFDRIDAVNSHHYTGTDAPEENFANWNTTSDAWNAKPPQLLFDQLRASTRAGVSDGKTRQHWLTEFGWDTLAGPVVSPLEQAAYLQRGYMLAMAAGCSKAFWFFNFDAEHPKQFFDGCGLMTFDGQPKLSLAAAAGLTHLLPNPVYLGTIEGGDDTGGYIFKQGDEYVAALFALHGDGPRIDLPGRQYFDFLGNAIAGGPIVLGIAPTYAVGLSEQDALFKQTAYSFDTDSLITAATGDRLDAIIRVQNNRSSAIHGTINFQPPNGWPAVAAVAVDVPAGGEAKLPVAITVAGGAPEGMYTIAATAQEGDQTVKHLKLGVMVQPGIALAVDPLTGAPGRTRLTVSVGNKARQPVSGKVRLHLPAGWKADTTEIAVDSLKPGERRSVGTGLTWRPRWGENESALAVFEATDGQKATQPVIPNQFALHRAGAIKIDGRLDDWTRATEVPQWMLGSTRGPVDTSMHMAWSPDGLYGAVEVKHSKAEHPDPKNFWAGDVLELFVDTRDRKTARQYEAGDHHFWLVPQPETGDAFVGQWKSGSEIAATIYGLAGAQTACRKLGDGYVMEFLIPAAALQKYEPGRRLGLNINLSVHGPQFNREVYWPRTKGAEGVLTNPAVWGSATLEP